MLADPIAHVVSEDRSYRRGSDDEPDVEGRIGGCVDGREDEDGLAWEGDAHALEAYDDRDCPVAVGGNKLLEGCGSRKGPEVCPTVPYDGRLVRQCGSSAQGWAAGGDYKDLGQEQRRPVSSY